MASATAAPAKMAARRSSATVAAISGATLNSADTFRPVSTLSAPKRSSHRAAAAIATCPADGRDRVLNFGSLVDTSFMGNHFPSSLLGSEHASGRRGEGRTHTGRSRGQLLAAIGAGLTVAQQGQAPQAIGTTSPLAARRGHEQGRAGRVIEGTGVHALQGPPERGLARDHAGDPCASRVAGADGRFGGVNEQAPVRTPDVSAVATLPWRSARLGPRVAPGDSFAPGRSRSRIGGHAQACVP